MFGLLPLTPETEGFVDGAFLDAMRPGALLVNAGRGKHVVTEDLVERLRAGAVTYGVVRGAQQETARTMAVERVFCGFCGKSISSEDVFCPHCGARWEAGT